MRETERLYYSQPSAVEIEARVVDVVGGTESPALVLDRTVFYPEGGGQPTDLGTIGGEPLSRALEEGGRILHFMARPVPFGPGDKVRLSLDAQRRADHSQQHTAQHLLSSLLLRLFDAPTLSFHLGAARCTIDVDIAAIGEEDLSEAEARAEEVIAADYPVIVHRCPPEDLSSFPLRRKAPEGEDEVRVVEIDGLDFTPCCGTHLASAGELRLLRILGAEKYKGMTRIAFVAGARAVTDSAAASRAAREAARAFGVSVTELPEKAARAAERLKSLESGAAYLERERAGLEAALAAAAPGGLPALAARSFADRNAAAAQESAKAFAARGAVGLCASESELAAVAASKRDLGLGALLKPLSEASGGKGGGGGSSFRASFPDRGSLASFMAAAAAALESALGDGSGGLPR